MDKKKKKLSPLARFRGFIQAGATLLTNIHLPNFAKGTLYQGGGWRGEADTVFSKAIRLCMECVGIG